MPAVKPSERYSSLFQCYATWDRRRDGTWFERQSPLDWRLLEKQAIAESGLDPDAVSPVGAKGLTQFMDVTWKEWEVNEFGPAIPPNRHVSVFDPEDAIRAQADVMGWLLGVWEGDARKSLASYNFGLGNVRKTIEKHGDRWEEFLPLETKQYLGRIFHG